MTVPKAEELIRIVNLGTSSKLSMGKIKNVSLLGYDSKLKWTQEGDALLITCPAKMDFHYAVCFKVN